MDANTRPEGLSNDEWRLVRMFRCMNRDERNDTLVEAGQRLMRRYSVIPSLRRYDMNDTSFADEMCPENVESYDQRLRCAIPWSDGMVLCWDNLPDPGAFEEDAIDTASDIVLGASENDKGWAHELAVLYVEWLDEYNPIQQPKNYYSQEQINEFLPEDFVVVLEEWRELVLKTIEKQARATDQERDGTEAEGHV